MLYKKTKFSLAIMLGIFLTACIAFTSCGNSGSEEKKAEDTVAATPATLTPLGAEEDTMTPPDTAKTRPPKIPPPKE